MLLSLKAGGVGLNLTAATHVFHFDRWWNPAVEDQATDRAYRIGQTKNVQVHKLITIGTLEEKVDAMLESKRDLADRVVGTGEGWLTELDDDALRRLVALDSDSNTMETEGPALSMAEAKRLIASAPVVADENPEETP
jgi:SNF2 family DNA or RNA helicase